MTHSTVTFVDNRAGENKNHPEGLTALRQVHRRRLKRAEFVYLVSGHS